MNKLHSLPFAFLCAFISATAWAAPPIAMYKIIEIPLLGSNCPQANAMNNLGDMVGVTADCSRAFFYQHSSGAVNYLTFNSESMTVANGISDSGSIVGWAGSPDFPAPVLWSRNGGVEALASVTDDFGATIANAVNNSGLVVGEASASGSPGGAALVWSGLMHTVAELPLLPCFVCPEDMGGANAVNDRRHIVGWSDFEPSPMPEWIHAVEWHDGTVTDLGDLGGVNGPNSFHDSVANGINNRDEIAGESTVESVDFDHIRFHAFLYREGKMLDLGTLPGDINSSAASIDDRGEIVGWSGTQFVSTRAFIYVNGQMYDLNTRIDPTSPLVGLVHLDAAVAINASGWIAANGTDSRDGLQHAYLLIRE